MHVPVRSFAACLALAACGGGASQQAAARLGIAAEVSTAGDDAKVATELRAALASHAVGAVVALDAAGLRAARAVVPASARPGARIVAIAELAAAQPNAPAETLVVDATGAAAAVDLALLAASGIAIPARVAIGTRTLAAANAAAGGTPRPAPGDVMIEMLRRQHADVVTTTPSTDVVLPIAFVRQRADGVWQDRVQTEVEAAAKRYPQLGLRSHVGDGSAARFKALAAEALAANVRVVLFAADDWAPLADIAKLPRDANVALVAITAHADVPHATCVVGPDQVILGRAAGEALRPLLGASGTCVVLGGDDAVAAARRQGFAAALGAGAK